MRQWEPLSRAIAASKAALRLKAEVEREAVEWDNGERDDAYLRRGTRLTSLEESVRNDEITLNRLETRFLEASKDLALREIRKVRRSNRRLQQLLAGVVALLLLATTAGVVAVSKTIEAGNLAELTLTRQLLVQETAKRQEQPDVALLLGVEALDRAPSALALDARTVLAQTLNQDFYRTLHYFKHSDAVRAVVYSPDGNLLASGGNDHDIRIWVLASGRQRGAPLRGHNDWVRTLAFSPDG